MADPLRKVGLGDSLPLSTRVYNGGIDAAVDTKARRYGVGRRRLPPSPRGDVWVRNSSGADVPRFGVLAIDGPVFGPDANLAEFQNQPCFEGVAPAADLVNFVVLQEPLADGAIGRGTLQGLTVAKVLVAAGEEALRFAESGAGSTSLLPADAGQAEILWREPGTGERWALVRIGNSPSTGAGVAYLGVVVAPSSDGAVASSYTVNIHGRSIASLSDAPTLTATAAIQSPAADAYYRGEVVGLRRIDDNWFIQKFLTLPIAYTVAANQVCLRLVAYDNVPSLVTNFMVDLFDLLTPLDAGAEVDPLYVTFGFAGYGGLGVVQQSLSVPVLRQPEWTLCTVVGADTSVLAAVARLVTGTITTVTTSSYSATVSGPAVAGVGATYSNGVVLWSSVGIPSARVWALSPVTVPSVVATFWGTLPIPSITGGVDSSASALLLLLAEAITTPGAAGGYRTVPAGGTTWAGTYTLEATGLITVS